MTIPLALVLGAEDVAGLTAARALAAAGVEVHGVAGAVDRPALSSRAWAERHVLPALYDGSDADGAAALAALARRLARPAVVVLVRDRFVAIVSRHRAALRAAGLRMLLPDPEITDTLLHKDRFAAWAVAHRLPVPRTETVPAGAGWTHLTAAIERVRRPAVVKPVLRDERWQAVMGDRKAVVVGRDAEARRVAAQLRTAATAGHDLVVQHLVDGPDDAVRFCLGAWDGDGRELALVSGRKLMQWPPGTGTGAIVCTAGTPGLVELTRALAGAARLRGVASVEVKLDRSGAPWIIEPTVGRLDAVSALGEEAGAELVLRFYRAAAGLDPLAPPRPSRGALVAMEPLAARALGYALVRGRVPARLLLENLRHAGVRRGAYVDCDDLGPLRAALTPAGWRR